MTLGAGAVRARLDAAGIAFSWVDHAPVYTMEEMRRLGLPDTACVAKNLFVRDHRKRRYFLLTLAGERRVDLKALAARLGTKPLGLASEADLRALLGLYPGAVTPFGLLNDAGHRVTLLLDGAFRGRRIGVHPNDNAATVYLPADELLALLRASGSAASYLDWEEARP